MKNYKIIINELKNFLLLWLTQSFSALGSSMTNFALVVWSYEETGSALTTALLMVFSYAPYVLISIFAGAISDKWSKKTIMLISDTFAAFCTVIVLVLLKTENLEIWHLYILNALNGLMNTFQQPASDVAVSLLTSKQHYQKVSGMRTFSNSLNTILAPIIATALISLTSIEVVIFFDLITFAIAFLTLLFFIKIPSVSFIDDKKETILQAAKIGIQYLRKNRGILDLILFLSAINFTASMFNATLPALLLSVEGGGKAAYGIVNMFSGIAMLIGSIVITLIPAPKSRVRVICNTLLLSMSTENFFLAFGKSLPIWCIGAVLGWISIPIMNANMDVLLRNYVPIDIQGRVYSARNALQFFTIPLGYTLGGILVDTVFEPFMEKQSSISIFTYFFGSGKGSGAAMFFLILGFLGVATCLIFRNDSNIWDLE
ncbi:MFS transporter [Clostridium ihumii]|uniref:MFS transporter n=1 Tax=Clostridium ihumii TaxID=1470356 RepID=UPI003D332BB7